MYVLKLAQVAVASQATRFDLKLRRSQVELSFDSAEMARVLPQKLARLLEEPSAPSGPLGDLVAGLLDARTKGGLTWNAWDGQRAHQLEILAHATRLGKAPGVGCQLLLDKPPPPLFVSISRTSNEHRLAYSRLRYAPIAVLVDGRAINDPDLAALTPEGVVEGLLGADCPRRFLLAERYLVPRFPAPQMLAGPGPSARAARVYRLPAFTWLSPLDVRVPQTLVYEGVRVWDPPAPTAPPHPALRYQLPVDMHPDPRPLGCLAALGIPVALEGPARVWVVENGVLLEPETVDLGCPGVVAVISGDGLTIRALQVLRDSAWEQRMATLRGHIAQMVEGVREHLGLLKATDPEVLRYARQRLPGA